MTAPLTMSLDVRCSPERAFRIWTNDIATWWPADHTVSGERDLDIVIEGYVGGRIFERTTHGVEHDWGQVTVWDPPTRLAYRWHLRQDREDATDVEIHFHAVGSDETRVEIEHRGWERWGDAATERRTQNHRGWATLLPHYLAASEKGVG